MLEFIKTVIPQPIKKLAKIVQSPVLFLSGRFFRRKIVWIDEINPDAVLSPPKLIEIYKPCFHQECLNNSISITNKVPQINLYKFSNVLGNVTSSSFYDSDNIYIERLQGIEQENANYVNGYILSHNSSLATLKKINDKIVVNERLLFLAGNGSFNYFHWLIEILPKLLLAYPDLQLFKIDGIVVNDRVRTIPSFRQSLELLLKELKLNYKIFYFGEDKLLHFNEVLYLTTFNHTLYNSKDNRPKIEYSYFRDDIIKHMSDIILSAYSKNFVTRSLPRRFFVRRGNSTNPHNKRFYNETEVEKLLVENEITAIYIEDFNFIEQAFLFKEAELIVAPSGAVWSNLIFIRNNPLCLSWLPIELKDFSFFSTLAHHFGGKMLFTQSVLDDPTMIHGKQMVDLKGLEKLVQLASDS